MKISLDWLADYLPGSVEPQVAADALTLGGLPVENIERPAGDVALDVEVTSNRADCLSHVGVARELSALLDRPLGAVDRATAVSGGGGDVSQFVSVENRAPALCPAYTARLIRGVKIRPSPDWLARRLTAIGVRPINNVVDVTNYVMFELGQPLHAFDAAKVGGNIVVREAVAGETIVSIDGHTRALSPGMLVIADVRRPIALAGVMGGRDTEVNDSTVDVLLESARFDALCIRKTARTLAMKSDSSYRYERGIDPALALRAGARAVELILQTAGGVACDGVVVAGDVSAPVRSVALRLPRIKKILGVDVEPQVAIDCLIRLGFSPKLEGETIQTTIPSRRADIGAEIDLIEEIARLNGYDRIPTNAPLVIRRLAAVQPSVKILDLLRQSLTSAGFFEAITLSFVSDLLADEFTPGGASRLARVEPAVRKADARLRPSILPGLLESVRHNESVGVDGARLFEIGSTFVRDSAGGIDERRRVALVGSDDLRQTRGSIEAMLLKLNGDRRVQVIPAHSPGFARGACGRIEWDGIALGHLGRMDSAIVKKLSLRRTPMAAELELAPILAHAELTPRLTPLPRFPAVRRDLSLTLKNSVPFADVEKAIRSAHPAGLEAIEFVTTYRGKPLAADEKSVTVTLVFRSATGTLTGEAVDAAVKQVVVAAAATLGAALRS